MHWPNNLVITIYLLISYLRDNELVVDNLVSALLIRWSVTSGGAGGGCAKGLGGYAIWEGKEIDEVSFQVSCESWGPEL